MLPTFNPSHSNTRSVDFLVLLFAPWFAVILPFFFLGGGGGGGGESRSPRFVVSRGCASND